VSHFDHVDDDCGVEDDNRGDVDDVIDEWANIIAVIIDMDNITNKSITSPAKLSC
jgi:hypothetical protein